MLLYTTDETVATIVILNREIMAAYRRIISVWFNEKVKRGTSDLSQTLLDEKSVDFQKEVNLWLRKSISYHDENESFYH